MRRVDILNSLKISKEDIVLEIGPGDIPFHRSNVYLEKDLTINAERAGDFQLTRPCVLRDAHCIPFDDKSIDYVFCSQVLEHSDDPERMLNEITRVGKRGYIETPNFYRELLFGWPFHKWVVEKEDKDRLVLYENKLPQYFGELFHKLKIEEYSASLFFSLNFEKFNTSLEWGSSIDYEIRGYDELMIKYTKIGKEKFFINSDNKPIHRNYKGILRPSTLVLCIPFLRRHRNILLKMKKLLTKNPHNTNLNIDVKTVIKKMKCMSCGGKFEDYIGKERVNCRSCSNFLTIKDNLLILDNVYRTV